MLTHDSFVRFLCHAMLLVVLASSIGVSKAMAQEFGSLVSPGQLSQAHASLDGLKNCEKCHEPGKKVTAEKCLVCHKPIAERIAAKSGVHRKVSDACVSCHIEHAGRQADMRHFNTATFDHAAETGYALAGKHTLVGKDCAKCHTARSFLAARPECASCHQDPHRGTLGNDCASCHSMAVAFKDTKTSFDHSHAAFQLSGAHIRVACEKCHQNKVYRGLKFESCASCHASPHRQAFAAPCASCHVTDSWKTEKVDHFRTGFPLRAKHAEVACVKCHVQPATRVRLQFDRCASCHQDPHRGKFREDCASCHNESGFRGGTFDHTARTTFALTGRHAATPCAACHKAAAISATAASHSGRTTEFGKLDTACATCHQDPHAGKLGATCANCHTTETFKVASFQHPAHPEFFAGSHAPVACAKCHVDGAVTATAAKAGAVASRTYRGLSMECASCHKDVHLGQLGTACASCHSIDAAKFAAPKFVHDRTAFPLTGRHTSAPCAKCHVKDTATFPAGHGSAIRYAGTAHDCVTCHRDVHAGSLGTKCQTCHATATFALAVYTHRADAELFVGKHATLECVSCHKAVPGEAASARGLGVRFANLKTACASCHKDPHNGTLGTRCESCHASNKPFRDTSRAFHKATSFPLEGNHLKLPCASCHIDGILKGTPTRCFECHWVRRQDDRYSTRLGVQCEQCHQPSGWRPATWDHATVTGFALNASHRNLNCESCHRGGIFRASAPPECYGCHRRDFEQTTNPSHLASGFPTACTTCHTSNLPTWQGATFNHAAVFGLVGTHATQPCAACHINNVYKGTARDCVGCHLTAYQQTKNPNHVTAGFPTTCETCHRATDSTWNQGTFNHATVFPLVGVHATQPCAACHINGVYHGTPRECVGCHLTAYQQARNPNHLAAAFPTTCQTCHYATDSNWQLGRYSHSAWPLVGAHTGHSCSTCHVNNVYQGLSSECVSCHLTAYQQAQNPNHIAAGFPTTCQTCHRVSDTSWQQGTFNHTWFPITSGKHANRQCNECHPNPSSYAIFTCTTSCHPRSEMDQEHRNRSGYVYDSVACYSCHPNGRGD